MGMDSLLAELYCFHGAVNAPVGFTTFTLIDLMKGLEFLSVAKSKFVIFQESSY